jgi:hypothetical protein
MPGLVPGIQSTACFGASFALDPGDTGLRQCKRRDDKEPREAGRPRLLAARNPDRDPTQLAARQPAV